MTPEFLATYPAVTLNMIERALVGEERRAYEIMRKVALDMQVDSSHIMGPFRDRDSVAARHRAMRCIREELQWSTPRIGKFFDRDHTTVLHALGFLTRGKKHGGVNVEKLPRTLVPDSL